MRRDPARGPRRATAPAVIVGIDCITGLQTARLLARHAIPIVGVAGDRRHFSCRTRVCDRIVTAPMAGTDLVEALIGLGSQLPTPAALLPVTDGAVHAISAERGRLEPFYRFALPPHEVVDTLMDKVHFARFAGEHGLPVPKAIVLGGDDGAVAAASELRYPLVVKPAMKTPEWWAHTKAKAIRIPDAPALAALEEWARPWAGELIVQEWIPGGEDSLYSWNGYVTADGTPIASFVARKIRQWPPFTGTSSISEECRNDEVLAQALRLIGSVPYHGLGYVEIKRHAGTGEHFIVEPNVGRPTGRSAIAEAGGVDLHYAAYCDMLGLPLPANLVQQYGRAKWIYLRHDLQAALLAWRRGELTFGEWRRSVRGVRVDAVFARDDPAPFLADVVGTASTGLRMVAARLAAGARSSHA